MNKYLKIIVISILIGVFTIIYFGKKVYEVIKYEQRISEILSDDKEIERKWLIKREDIPYNLNDINVQKFEIK